MIRAVTYRDLDAIVVLAHEAHALSEYRHVPTDEPKFRKLVLMLATSKQHLALVSAGDEGTVNGFLLGFSEEIFFSRKKYATDLMVYARHPRAGLALTEHFIEWALAREDVVQIVLGVSATLVDPRAAGRLYRRLGLNRVGGLYEVFPDRPAVCEQS